MTDRTRLYKQIEPASGLTAPRVATALDWLLFWALLPAVLGIVLVFGDGILLGFYWSFWLALTIIGILVLPFCAMGMGALGIGMVSIARLWWALIRPPERQLLTDYLFVGVCSAFSLVALVGLHNVFMEDYWTIPFDGKEFFDLSVDFVALSFYPLLALVIALRVRLRRLPTVRGQHGIFAHITAGAAIAGFWLISAAGVINFQGRLAPLVKSLRMSSPPSSDPAIQHYDGRGPIADAICRGNLQSAREALDRNPTDLTNASVLSVMECLTPTRWINGGPKRETVFTEERVPLILDLILQRERLLAINPAEGCPEWQAELQQKLIELGQLASLQVFVDRHLSMNCVDWAGNPVFWSAIPRSVAALKQLQSMGVDLFARDSTGRQLLTANPGHFVDTVDGEVLSYLVDQETEQQNTGHPTIPFSVALLSRLEQGAGTAPISPQIAEKLLDRMDEPSTQELVESVKSYDEVSRKIDSFAVLVASYRARMNDQDRTLQFTAAAPASKGDVLVTVWIESDGDVLERQNRPDQPSLWFQWHAPATVINTLQMMVHDPVFGDLHRKNARTADSDRVNAAACVRFRWVGGDSGYLNDRQARMLTFVLDAARSASVVQSVASNATGVNACTPDVSNIGMQKVTF